MGQQIDDNHGQITQHGDIHIHAQTLRFPPVDHPNSRECPQCGEITWRMTQHCIACHADLFSIDADDRAERLKWRRLKVMAFFGVLGFGPLMVINHIPGDIKTYVSIGSIVSMFIALAIARDD